MGYFRIVANGPQLASPSETIVTTAAEAEAQSDILRRQCGKHGKVEVWGKDGRMMSPDKLRRLIQEEGTQGAGA